MPSIANDTMLSDVAVREQEPIAIIGMASRFPQEADSNENLWKFLLQGRSAMTPFPEDRFNAHAHYHPDPEHGGTFHTKGAHFMTGDPASFDSQFFNITKTEVMTMDPQQRVLLENVYQALENAGIPLSKATSSMTSVFVSGFNHDFLQVLNKDTEVSLKYMPTGMSDSILSNRISWFYDFKAPSMTVDTACSSSMVAFHLACQNLRYRESEMSVVSGVSVLMLPEAFSMMSTHGFLSPDGKCFSFDHRANGYSRGEGVGTVIIKRLSDALRDGDTIRAVVRGTGVNQDGRTPGITLPSGKAQEKLIRDTYAKAGLDVTDTMFIESHGTGTPAGDPIEARAIADAFRSRPKDHPLYVGAMKSAIGHLEGTAGVASLIKSVLILESGVIPPNANFEKANPKIPASKWNIQFPVQPTPWPSQGQRRLSINASGFGGTNAHTILDDAYHFLESRGLTGVHNTAHEAPSRHALARNLIDLGVPREDNLTNGTNANGVLENGTESHSAQINGHGNGIEASHALTNGVHENGTAKISVNGVSLNGDSAPGDSEQPHVFLWHAFDEAGIARNAGLFAQHLKSLPPMNSKEERQYLADLAHTLSSKRSAFAWRSSCVASSVKELIDMVEDGSGLAKSVRASASPRLCFVFTGQGAQWYAMGRELLVYPVFKRSLEDATSYMKSLGSQWSLLDELLEDEANSKINQPSLAQPACAALQIALVDLLASWGVLPSRVLGHSSGEIAAAYAARKLGREDAWKVAYHRGVVSAKPTGVKGAMMAVGMSADELIPHVERLQAKIPGELVIACYNSPKNNTVSGAEEKIDALKKVLDEQSVFARKLKVTNAYHSALMKPVSDEYAELLGDLTGTDLVDSSQDVHMFSSVTGALVEGAELQSTQYWIKNLVSPVRFTAALTAACTTSLLAGQKPMRMNGAAENVFADEIIEVGPHSALRSAITETIKSRETTSAIGYSSTLNRSSPVGATALKTAAYLYCKGYPVDISVANKRPGIKRAHLLVRLPPYSFDHSDTTWHESRISKNYRQREHPKHDLFGARVPDWNAKEPRWRHIIRISENPWLRDHQVTGLCIYPGMGYIVMALEAAKQMSDPKLTITGYRLRDVAIRTALTVPDTKDGVEVNVSMIAKDESSMEGSKTWSKFRISSYDPIGNDWLEHCTGYVAVEHELRTGPVDGGREAAAELKAWKDELDSVSQNCKSAVDMNNTYENWHNVGITLGPYFNNLSDVKLEKGQGEVKGRITVPDLAEVMPKRHVHPHVIHPCTLDAMLQLFLTSIPDCAGITRLQTAILPTFVKEVWVSAATSSSAGHTFRGHGKSRVVASQKYESDITVWDGELDEGRVILKGAVGTPVSNVETADLQARKLCHEVVWKPDLELFKAEVLPNVKLSSEAELRERRKHIEDLQLASMLLITDGLKEVKDIPTESYEGHYQNYYQWLLHQEAILKDNSMSFLPLAKWEEFTDNQALKDGLYREVGEASAEGALTIRMGTHIAQVLRKEVDPLHLMFGLDNLIEKVYDGIVGTGDLVNLTKAYLEMVGHSCTDLRILEIGAGTGASTIAALETLSPRSGRASMIAKYTFSDISSGFFEKARERFQNWSNIMEFKTLNIEKNVEDQGFEPGQYDIIVAGNVLHATADLKSTLSNVRHLLRPGGRLIMQEGIRQDILALAVSFGQLPGWWLSIEPIRKWGPWISQDDWDHMLRETGFSGVDTSLKDRQVTDLHIISTLVSSAVEAEPKRSELPEIVAIVTSAGKNTTNDLSSALLGKLERSFGLRNCSLVNFADLKTMNLTSTLCISLLELEGSLLMNPTKDEYENVRHLLATCDGLLWVTGDINSSPQYNMIAGLLRTVRWERDVDGVNMIALSVADPMPSGEAVLQATLELFEHQFYNADESKANAEYLLQDGVFYSNRLVDATEMNDYLNAKNSAPPAQMLSLGEVQAERALKLTTSSPGLLNKLEFVTDNLWNKPLGATDVEIRIKAVGLNFRDVMIAMGEHNAMTFGSEASGLITRVGSAVQNVKVGDRVVYMDGVGQNGTFQTYGRTAGSQVTKIPDSMSYEAAAALPSVYCTALYGLYYLAHISKGETVLIHGAAGGVGQAAITLAHLVGATVFATVSTPEKADLIATEYGVQRDHIFSSRDLSFAKGVMRMTKGRGVDVILNSLSGDSLRASWECIAPLGRFIEIGKRDAQNNARVSLNPFLKNVMMASVELPTMMRHRPEFVVELMEEVVRLYSDGKVREASPTTVRSYSELEESFRMLQSGKGMGKTVLMPKDDDIVPVVPEANTPYRFQENASYVLAGGLGGIGRSTAKWMAARGAKNLIFISRSGAASQAAQETVKELESLGVKVAVFSCDVSNRSLLASTINRCSLTLPPIKGCIQGSMVLSDVMFENMPFEEYNAAIKPKVQGSWNLHELLPTNMDFFILLSSITGVSGSRSQANYAAGNTYQDALAAYRVSKGLPGMSLDLGPIFSLGYIAENSERLTHAKNVASQLGSVREDEVHHMMEYALDHRVRKSTSQITSGLTTASQFLAQGMPTPMWISTPLFTQLASTSAADTGIGSDDSGSVQIGALLSAVVSLADAVTIISDAIRTKLSKLLNIAVDNIDLARSVSSHGVDSLVAVELRTWLAKILGADVPMLDIMGTMPLGGTGLGGKVASVSKLVRADLRGVEAAEMKSRTIVPQLA